jgi:hypothetical protein
MSTHVDTAHNHSDDACCAKPPLIDRGMAQRLLLWVTIGGLALGTFGTFHSVTSLAFASPDERGFVSARLQAVHHFALVTVVAAQVLQLIGSVALWRRRLLGRTLLLTYATVYLGGLLLVQTMRAIDTASYFGPATASQRAMVALGEMHLIIYGSVFPLFLAVVLTRPWIVSLLRRKGEPLPEETPSTDTAASNGEAHPQPPEQRLAA